MVWVRVSTNRQTGSSTYLSLRQNLPTKHFDIYILTCYFINAINIFMNKTMGGGEGKAGDRCTQKEESRTGEKSALNTE